MSRGPGRSPGRSPSSSPFKRGRQRTRNPEKWGKNKRAKSAQTGLKFTNFRHQTQEAREMGSICCKKQCLNNRTVNFRTNLFQEYWHASPEGKHRLLRGMVTQSDPRRKNRYQIRMLKLDNPASTISPRKLGMNRRLFVLRHFRIC